jgi:transposase
MRSSGFPMSLASAYGLTISRGWPAAAGFPSRAQRHSLDFADRSPMGGSARAVSAQKHLPSTLPGMDRSGGFCQNFDGTGPGPERTGRHRPERGVYRRNLCSGKKRGDGVGKTKRGKGTKIMGLTDAFGLPIAVDTTSASPHEITLVDQTLDACFLEHVPEKVIGDRAYDSDKLDQRLARQRGGDLIAPHKGNRKKAATQDGRPLRRFRKRWKVERLFAWLQNFRRLVVRYEYHLQNFLAMVQLGCVIILLRRVLG